MQILKIIFFIISSIGFYLHTSRKINIKKEFIPIVVISTITVIIFLSGILNFMKIATIILGILGFVLAIYEIYNIIKNKKKLELEFSLVIFFIALCLLAYILKGVILTHYDNFSHWAMIIKDILLNDKLPTSTSKTIMFTSYPPATACFVYYVCRYIGTSETLMLFAQSILILSSIYTIFALCNKENKINWIISILLAIYLLLGNIFIDQLLVDTVLAVMGIAGLIIIQYYKNNSKKGILYSIPVLSVLILVKNSGIFFVIVDLLMWLIYYIKNHGIKELLKTKYLLIIFVPFLLLSIWNVHIKLAFDGAETAKHSMSLENYIDIFKGKTLTDIKDIFKLFVKENLSFSEENILVIGLLVGFTIIYIISNKELRKDVLFWFLTFIGTYAIYQISLFAMYIFSMPLLEAKNLAGYTRYNQTIILFEAGILIFTILNLLNSYDEKEKIKKTTIKTTAILVMILAIMLSPNKISVLYKKNSNSIRYEIMNIKKENNIEERRSYLVYLPEDKNYDTGYIYYICRYEFMSANINVIRSVNDIKNKVYNYNYLIILKNSREMNNIIEELGGKTDTNVIKIR